MSIHGFDALPVAHRETARSALASVVGPVPIGAITPVTGGATAASIFRIEAGDRRYLLRIEGPASPLRNPHQYVSLRMAAEAGIAPKLHYVDDVARDRGEPNPVDQEVTREPEQDQENSDDDGSNNEPYHGVSPWSLPFGSGNPDRHD